MRKLFIVLPLVLAMSACSSFRGSSVTETKTFSNEVDYRSGIPKHQRKILVPYTLSQSQFLSGKLQALLPVGKSQSKELLVFLFTTQELTLRKQYSKIEFEQMVKELPFTTRKIVNHQINIMR